MSKHDDDTCPHLVRASLLEAENARLKAEVERLKAEKDQAECDYDNCQKRKVSIDNHRFDLFTENKNLKAEVERLTKAGNAMVLKLPDMMAGVVKAEEAIGLMNDWISAKEGKPTK